jgi:hypothetical protein
MIEEIDNYDEYDNDNFDYDEYYKYYNKTNDDEATPDDNGMTLEEQIEKKELKEKEKELLARILTPDQKARFDKMNKADDEKPKYDTSDLDEEQADMKYLLKQMEIDLYPNPYYKDQYGFHTRRYLYNDVKEVKAKYKEKKERENFYDGL